MITEEKIWGYLDSTLTSAERTAIEQAVDGDKQAAELFKEISELHNSLRTETLMRPSLSFTNRVMAAVEAAPVNAPVAKIPVKLMLLFAFPTLAVIALFVVLIIKNHIPVAIHLPVIDFGKYKLPFVLADVLLFAYIIDMLPANSKSGLGLK